MKKNINTPNVYIIFTITVLIFFLVLMCSMGNTYISGKLIDEQKVAIQKTKICIYDFQKTLCSLTNRYGKFVINNSKINTGDTVKIIVRTEKNVIEQEIKITEKTNAGFNVIYELGNILIK